LKHYTILAEVFRYPEKRRTKVVSGLMEIVNKLIPEMNTTVKSFVEHVQHKSIPAQQEYFIATFDIQALCFLDIGYVLYGEDYNRGVFLVNMKNEQEKAGVDCGSELPDHLPNILTLLPKLQDEKMAEEMICSILIPAWKR
jgi:nitrate reductase assembly molybdenum cofactor insertion protein NarJ